MIVAEIVGGALFGSLALPIMWSTGTGSEIMQCIAVPMSGHDLLDDADADRDPGDLWDSRGSACRMAPTLMGVRRLGTSRHLCRRGRPSTNPQ